MAGPLIGAIGGAVAWLGKGKIAGKGVAGLMAGSGVVGMTNELTNQDGPWRGMAQETNEFIFGDPHPLQSSINAAVRTELTNPVHKDVVGLDSYYYGRPVNPPRNISRPNVAPGEMVFGMYNNRR